MRRVQLRILGGEYSIGPGLLKLPEMSQVQGGGRDHLQILSARVEPIFARQGITAPYSSLNEQWSLRYYFWDFFVSPVGRWIFAGSN